MPWHPVPRRAAWLYLRYRLLMTCSRRISFVFYKEATLFLGLFFWLHQGRIPHRMCRFHCCLAAHQRTRKKDSAEPSFPILWTPPHPPGGIRCGGALLLPRVYTNTGICIPVQVDHRHFDISIGCFVFGLGLFAFQSGCWAGIFRFSLLDGKKTLFGWLGSFVFGLPLTATLCQFRRMQAHFTNCAGCKTIGKLRSYNLHFKKTGFPCSLSH